MTTLTRWLRQLLLADALEPEPTPDGLTVWLSVGSELAAAPADLALEAGSAERAEEMLRVLARGGHVARIWLAVAPELGETAVRRLRRAARGLRAVALEVTWLWG